jgi:hypothetical protein
MGGAPSVQGKAHRGEVNVDNVLEVLGVAARHRDRDRHAGRAQRIEDVSVP